MKVSGRHLALLLSTYSATSVTTTTAFAAAASTTSSRLSFLSKASIGTRKGYASWVNSIPRGGSGTGTGIPSFVSTTTYSSSSKRLIPTTTRTSLKMSSSAGTEDSAATGKSGSIRVALCQFRVCNDKLKNHATANEYIHRASKAGAELVVLPEIWNSPYATSAFPDYAEVLPNVGDTYKEEDDSNTSSSHNLLMKCAKQYNMWIVGGSIPEKRKEQPDEEEKIYNTCLVIDPNGCIVAKHSKVHLFDIDVPGKITFFESDTLSSGNQLTSFITPRWGTIGIGICYDIRFPEYAMVLCKKSSSVGNPLNLLIYPGAFNLTTGPAHWELLQRARALDNQCFVLTASPARTTEEEAEAAENEGEKQKKYPHYTAWGHSTIVSPWGDVVATTDEKESLVVADLDLTKVDEIRKAIPILQQKRHDLYKLEENK